LAIADGEYDRDLSHAAKPAANGANGPDSVGTHTFLPIEASNRIAHNVNPTGVGRTNDYVERTNARMSDFAAKTWPAEALLNMDARVTYNRTCQFPGIRLKQALLAGRRAEALGRCRRRV
jgi:hypothetical protein